MNEQQIEQLTERAAALPAAIQERAVALAELRAQLAVLEETSCTGQIQWRRDKGKSPKMYANHSINESCPIHGQPEKDKRLRIYVGLDPEKQAEAEAAIENEEKRQKTKSQVDALAWSLDRLDSELRGLFLALGYTYLDDGDEPQPDPDWRPGVRRWY